jgi:hypothetical protein
MSEDVMQGWIENPVALQKALADALCPPKEEKEVSSFRSLGIQLTISAQPECKVSECLTDKSVFAYRDPEFDKLLLQTLPASKEVKVSGYELARVTTEAELATVGRKFTNLRQIEDLILRTEKGEKTGILTNRYANIFFLEVGGSVFTVDAHRRYDGWYVFCLCFRASFGWLDGRRFFSPAT